MWLFKYNYLISVTELQSYLSSTSDEIFIETDCERVTGVHQSPSDWGLCENEVKRGKVLKESTFALIPAVVSSPSISVRLYEALRAAAVPLIIGDVTLPYHEVPSKYIYICLFKWNTSVMMWTQRYYFWVNQYFLPSNHHKSLKNE